MRIIVVKIAAFIVLANFAGQSVYGQDLWQPPLQNEDTPQDQDLGGGLEDLLGRGMDQMMNDLMRDLGPGLDQLGQDFSGAIGNLTPLLKDLGDQVDDLRYYQAPERLENGDIILRRRADAPPPPPMGEDLRNFTTPDSNKTEPDRVVPSDPYALQFDL